MTISEQVHWWQAALHACLGPAAAQILAAGWTQAAPAAWVAALERRYGPRAGQGLAVRVGRALFGYLPLPVTVGMVPLRHRERVLHGLTWLGAEGGAPLGLQAQAEATATGWRWRILAPQDDPPACPVWRGLLQETLYWFGGGMTYQVEEVACRRQGAPHCVFHIPYRPLR